MRIGAVLVLFAVLAGGVWGGMRLLGDGDDARSHSRVLDAVAEGGILHLHTAEYVRGGHEIEFRCPNAEPGAPGSPYTWSGRWTDDSWVLFDRDGVPEEALLLSVEADGLRVASLYVGAGTTILDHPVGSLTCIVSGARERASVGGPGGLRADFRRQTQDLKDGEASGELRREPSDIDGTFVLVRETTACDKARFRDVDVQRLLQRRLVLESDYSVLSDSCWVVTTDGEELLVESTEVTLELLDASEWPALLDLVFPEGLPAGAD